MAWRIVTLADVDVRSLCLQQWTYAVHDQAQSRMPLVANCRQILGTLGVTACD